MRQILFLIYDLERGGPELRIVDLARELEEKIGIHICSMSNKVALLDDVARHGAHVTIKTLRKPWLEWSTVKDIRDYAQINLIEAINVFDLKGLIATYFPMIGVCRNKQFPKVVYHCVSEISNEGFKGRTIVGMINKCDAVICNSFFSANQAEANGVSKRLIRVIHNGVDTTKFSKQRILGDAVRLQYDIPAESFTIGTVANFRHQKNYPFLIAAFAQILEEVPVARLLCVGGGPDIDECRTIAAQAGLLDKVIFTGYVNDTLPYLNTMDVFCLCSLSEGLPNAVMQAMACELPVVVTRVGGCPELIKDTHEGFLFEPNEMETFVRLVSGLAEDPALRTTLGGGARKKIAREFSLDKMVSAYKDLFLSI